METISVILADDHPIFRSGLAALLAKERGFNVVGEAQDGEEAFRKACDLKPDIVLMDLYMPGCNGLQATRRIRESLPDVKVVILTISEEDKNLFEAIKSGAQGYLLKTTEANDLFGMLRGISRGEAPISRVTAARILDEFTKQSKRHPHVEVEETLTQREMDVLESITKGLTNKEIGNKLCITENTVKNHLKKILDKLCLENRVQAAAFALEKGLIKKNTLQF